MQTYISLRSATGLELIRILIYYCQRLITFRHVRRFASRIVLKVLTTRYGSPHINNSANSQFASELTTEGIVRLPNLLNAQQCADINAYLQDRTLTDSRGSQAKFTLDNVPAGCKLGDYDLDTIVNGPHILKVANDPDLIRLATRYLGFVPVITGLSVRWSFPGTSPDGVQNFHRDCEVGSVKVLIYLSDVELNSGPHTFINGSHAERMPLRLKRYTDEETHKNYRRSTAVIGPAGTTFAIDTKGLHKGAVPVTKPRLMLGIQYSLLPCFIFKYSPAKYLGNAYIEYYINRLIIEFPRIR